MLLVNDDFKYTVFPETLVYYVSHASVTAVMLMPRCAFNHAETWDLESRKL